jgi:hypothetical protein
MTVSFVGTNFESAAADAYVSAALGHLRSECGMKA